MTGHQEDGSGGRSRPGSRRPGAADGRAGVGGSGVGSPGLGRLAEAADRVRAALDGAGGSADARVLVDRATGVLMERLGCGPEEALRHLHERAHAEGRAVLHYADEILSGRTERTSVPPVPASAAGAEPGLEPPSAAALPRWHAQDGQRAVKAILEHALTPFGADTVALWAARDDGGLRLVGRAGARPAPAAVAGGQAGSTDGPPVGPTGSGPAAEGAQGGPDVQDGRDVQSGQLPGPAAQAVASGTVVWADLSPAAPAVTVAVPAVRRGRVLGALEISWTGTPPGRDHRLERQLLSLAELAAHTMNEPAGTAEGVGAVAEPDDVDPALRQLAESLHDAALVLTPLFDPEGRLGDFRIAYTNDRFADPAGRPAALVEGRPLLQAYPGFGRPGGPAEKVEHVYATGESFRAERLALLAEIGDIPVITHAQVGVSRVDDAVLLTWRAQEDDARLGTLLQHAQRLGRIGGFEDDLLTSRSTWNQELYELFGLAPTAPALPLSHLRARVHRDDREAFDAFLAAVTLHQEPRDVAVRFHRGDQVVRHVRVVAEPVVDDAGTLVAIRGACQDVSAHHWTEVALSATRDQLAHTQAEADERARLARRLQHAIMPPTPGTVTMAGLTIGVRYRPAHQDHAVGGDWYDAVPLPNGDVLISVGDVAGHGIEAATGMVALRNSLRGLATTGVGPGQLLAWLNDVAFHLTENVTATAVCGIYQPERRRFRWARAGHPAPVLLHHGVSRSVDFGHGILLGAVPDACYEEQEMTLPEEATLLLFTDGLIERKDSSGLDDLHSALGSPSFPAAGSLAEQLDHLLTHSRSDTDDDTCLVGIHRPAHGPEPTG